MIPISLFLLSVASPTLSSFPLEPELKQQQSKIEPIFHTLFDSTMYLGAGTLLGSATLLTGIGGGICQITPWASTFGNECFLISRILGIAAIHSLAEGFKRSPLFSGLFQRIPSSYSAWNNHEKMLSQVPIFSDEDQMLVDFLKKRWLAKTTGSFPFLVDWMCPPFGISFQVHPETTNSYARDPSNKFSDTYKNRVKAWKQFLPHPEYYPLILTRPSDIRDYLPSCFVIGQEEKIAHFVARLVHDSDLPIIVDLTAALSNDLDRKQWLDAWQLIENQFSQCCQDHQLDPNQILFVQRVEQKDLGGFRLLPLCSSSKENNEKHAQFLLEWISRFGLSANRVELDRALYSPFTSPHQQSGTIPIVFESKEQWAAFLDLLEKEWKSSHPQKTLMFQGTLQVMKSLCASVSQEKWEEIQRSPTRFSTVQISFAKIQQQFSLLLKEKEDVSFHDSVTHIEQIHADLTSLIEIFAPFIPANFPEIFQHHLASLPKELQPLTKYALHSSGMTSLGGIFKAVERTAGKRPRVLFGENTYFECIHASERFSRASSTQDATDEDWKEADLVLAQFNPTVKRINSKVTEYQATEYHVEKIADLLHHALRLREGKPLSIAIDCTLDFSDSERVGKLLTEFQQEIEKGDLNVICYRSGLKFDMFGMDNYCGAPFFIIHNQDDKWSSYDLALTDPALQADRLSYNWFCLAFQQAGSYLEAYRKQIFDNTRAILNKIPAQLYDEKNFRYRVIPIALDADPSFIDIKIFGPLHALRGELLVGVCFTIKCMEAGYPLLFRPGIGFFHPNLAILFGKECTTVRLTVGLDPKQVDIIVHCLEEINSLNDSFLSTNIHNE